MNRGPTLLRLSGPVSLLLAVGLAGCGFFGPEVRPIDPVGELPEPIGPVVEIGRGESLGVTWRYLVFESAMGFCTEIELAGGPGSASCGGDAPGPEPAGSALGLMSVGSATGSPTAIEGFATDEVEDVSIELQDGGRVQASLMPLRLRALAGRSGSHTSLRDNGCIRSLPSAPMERCWGNSHSTTPDPAGRAEGRVAAVP